MIDYDSQIMSDIYDKGLAEGKRLGAKQEVEKILALAKRLGGVSLRYLQEELKELKELK